VSSLYLYAIVEKRPRASLGTLGVVRAGGVHVVFERGGVREPNAANLRKHDRVVRRIARECSAVLPFRFGSVVADRDSLRSLLEPISPAIERALDLVRDATQFTIRVYGKPAPRKRAQPGAGPGTKFLAERLRRQQVPEIDAVTRATKPFVRAARTHRHDRPPLVASVYHLVARSDARRYRAALNAAAKALGAVRIDVSGPWPPYAFSEMP
jgi:hypothetical protein